MEQMMKTSSVAEIGGCDHRLLIAGRERERDLDFVLSFLEWSRASERQRDILGRKEEEEGHCLLQCHFIGICPLCLGEAFRGYS